MAEMGLVEQAASILSAIRASVKDGRILADEATVKARLEICEACPQLVEKSKRGRTYHTCRICGCAHKRKVSVQGSRCPIGSW